MKLNLYRRHRVDCESGKPEDSRSTERDERRKGWGRKCQCQIHVSGTLARRFFRKTTGTSDWLEAHQIANLYEKAESWTGKPVTNPLAPVPAPAKARITIADACKVFITNRESAGLARATLRNYHTFTQQLAPYADSKEASSPVLRISALVDDTTVVLTGSRISEIVVKDNLYILAVGDVTIPNTNIPLVVPKATLEVTYVAGVYVLARPPEQIIRKRLILTVVAVGASQS